MTSIPAGIAANLALTQQNIAMSTIKQSAEADQKVAGILEQSAENIKALSNAARGQNLNVLA